MICKTNHGTKADDHIQDAVHGTVIEAMDFDTTADQFSADVGLKITPRQDQIWFKSQDVVETSIEVGGYLGLFFANSGWANGKTRNTYDEIVGTQRIECFNGFFREAYQPTGMF
jgi:hypothetical protein